MTIDFSKHQDVKPKRADSLYEIDYIGKDYHVRTLDVIKDSPITNPIVPWHVKTVHDTEELYDLCQSLETDGYIIKQVRENGKIIDILDRPQHHKDTYTQLCYETEAIFQDELKDKCPKTVYQYGPLIKEYVDLNAESSAKCVQLYQAANEEMTNAIKAYYQPFFDNFDATVANLKQLYNIQ